MEAFVSLWSADLLALGAAVRQVEDLADGFHVDVFDGRNVPELLFGPDLMRALRTHTAARIEVHLNVFDPGYWIGRFAEAGADVLTVQAGPCDDVPGVLERIRALGCAAGLGIELHEAIDSAVPLIPFADRLLLLGTPIGVKGRDLDSSAPGRLTELVRARERSGCHPAIVVDGGIRKHTVPLLAAAGADGVIPGSLVYAAYDPRLVLTEIGALVPGSPVAAASAFWTCGAVA
jgi:ribulose-phosphate 3-epimerase